MNGSSTTISIILNNGTVDDNAECSLSLKYQFVEHILYLYFMSPLCLIGLILNVINLIVFSDKSFKNLTFKYLKLIALVDCITCTLVFIYCITNYTQPRTFNDKFSRIWYLANVYFPLANITAGCNVLLTITVNIERLVSVRWPMEKQRLFNRNRVLITLFVCFVFPIVANSVNFLVYTVGKCNDADFTPVARTQAYKYFGICKEVLLRFIPICILICSNFLLLSTVRAANQKFKLRHRQSDTIPTLMILEPSSVGVLSTSPMSKYLSESQSQIDTFIGHSSLSTESTVPIRTKRKIHVRKQQQERQLTIMLVWLSTMYLCGQIPMLLAYPNFIFKNLEKASYKYYAVVVNMLELITYLANFFIYIRFTAQYRRVFQIKIRRKLSTLFENESNIRAR